MVTFLLIHQRWGEYYVDDLACNLYDLIQATFKNYMKLSVQEKLENNVQFEALS